MSNPYLAFLFAVTVDDAVVGGFTEVSGLSFESEVETLRVGGMNRADMQLLGPGKYPSRLVLKRGLADASYFWNWYVGVIQGAVVRRALTVKLRNADGGTPYEWTFDGACPVKWAGPTLQAGTSAVAFESIEFVHRGLHPPRAAAPAAG